MKQDEDILSKLERVLHLNTILTIISLTLSAINYHDTTQCANETTAPSIPS